jgi:acyl carrier protein
MKVNLNYFYHRYKSSQMKRGTMNEIQADILDFLERHGFLDKKITLQVNDSLSETGVIDSITLLELIDFLEGKYNIQIPLEMITPENFDTLAGISQSVMKLKNG